MFASFSWFDSSDAYKGIVYTEWLVHESPIKSSLALQTFKPRVDVSARGTGLLAWRAVSGLQLYTLDYYEQTDTTGIGKEEHDLWSSYL